MNGTSQGARAPARVWIRQVLLTNERDGTSKRAGAHSRRARGPRPFPPTPLRARARCVCVCVFVCVRVCTFPRTRRGARVARGARETRDARAERAYRSMTKLFPLKNLPLWYWPFQRTLSVSM